MRRLIAFGILALLAIPLVPAVEAKPYCVIGERDCRGYIVCFKSGAIPIERICVPDPCWTTHCWVTVRVDEGAVTTSPGLLP